jgi:N-acetylmuramoyl-L-alanine amidase
LKLEQVQPVPVLHSTGDTDTMFRTCWAEARGESYEGQIAVAWAIRNRAQRGYAGKFLGAVGAVDHVCKAPLQFSCWNSDDPNLPKLLALKIEDAPDLYDLCQDVLDGIIADSPGGADSYYAPAGMPGGLAPYWAASMKFCGQVGRQYFYDSSHGPEGTHRTLYINSTGDDVVALKKMLTVKGIYNGPIDASFTQSTKTAVEDFQRRVGLIVDGVVGPKTARALGLY